MKFIVTKNIILRGLDELDEKDHDWEVKSAKKFAKKKRLGEYESNREKDFAKMARAGFNYNIIKDILKIH